MNDRKARLKAAIKARDGWWARVFISKASIRVVSAIAETGVTPNQVTVVSLIVALAAAGLFYLATPGALIAGGVLLQVAFILDCADGQLARFKSLRSDIGGWLDQIADRTREFALIIALAAGYFAKTGDATIWPLAMTAFFLLWMLEYYSQQNWQMPSPPREAPVAGTSAEETAEGYDNFEGVIDRIFPIAGFRVGEQLLIVTLFTVVAGAASAIVLIKWLFITMCLLGGAHAVYRPWRRLSIFYAWKRKQTELEPGKPAKDPSSEPGEELPAQGTAGSEYG